MTTTAPTRVTYVESLSRNLIVADTSSRVVPERDPARIAREAGPGAYAFRFYDVVSTTADGIPVKSGHVNESPWYWIDAERLTAADVEALPGDYSEYGNVFWPHGGNFIWLHSSPR